MLRKQPYLHVKLRCMKRKNVFQFLESSKKKRFCINMMMMMTYTFKLYTGLCMHTLYISH